MAKPIPEQIRQIITNANYPLIFSNLLDWDCLSWNLKDWNNRLGEEKLQFRCGQNIHTQVYFELKIYFKYIHMTFNRSRNGKERHV